jgi:hypothetical protein
MDESDGLRRQVKILTICVASLTVAVIGLFGLVERQRLYADTWPSANLGELKVKKLTVVGDDGVSRVFIQTSDGSPTIAFLDNDHKPQLILGVFEHGPGLIVGKTDDMHAIITPDSVRVGDSTRSLLLSAEKEAPYLLISTGDKTFNTVILPGAIELGDESKKVIKLESNAPSVLVQDDEGYSTAIGKWSVSNGAGGTRTVTPASTLVGLSKQNVTTWPLIKTNTKK